MYNTYKQRKSQESANFPKFYPLLISHYSTTFQQSSLHPRQHTLITDRASPLNPHPREPTYPTLTKSPTPQPTYISLADPPSPHFLPCRDPCYLGLLMSYTHPLPPIVPARKVLAVDGVRSVGGLVGWGDGEKVKGLHVDRYIPYLITKVDRSLVRF